MGSSIVGEIANYRSPLSTLAGGEARQQSLWEREYRQLKVIPSSSRRDPSRMLVMLAGFLELGPGRIALDAGCGIGRNSIFLAQKGCCVHAIDFSPTALGKLAAHAAEADVKERIQSHPRSLFKRLPFDGETFDLVLDSYVLCHFMDPAEQEHYRGELYRVTKRGGLIYSSLFPIEDAYYRPHAEASQSTTTVTDPANGITKKLYSEGKFKEFYGREFQIEYFSRLDFQDIVLGKPYWRSVMAMIMRK